jgi:hypothetical protein
MQKDAGRLGPGKRAWESWEARPDEVKGFGIVFLLGVFASSAIVMFGSKLRFEKCFVV